MGLKKKTVATNVAENSLKKKAEDNTTVTRGTSKNQKTLKSGNPSDHHRKQSNTGADLLNKDTVVGMNVGITKNMDNYESLRVDCWLTDTVKEGETVEQAYERILGVIDSQLHNTVNSYLED